jgi:trimethylamine-N-oxide reductase (cytochrome c) cytochrome c-type subunit TorY
VSIEGWSASGSNAVVAAIGQRILLVIVTAPARAERQTGTQTKDAYGTTWTQVTISGWVTTSVLTSDIQAVWARASKLYASHCSTCHALHAPDEFAANQWPGVLQSMADRSGLSGDDLALVLKYLQTHAKAR